MMALLLKSSLEKRQVAWVTVILLATVMLGSTPRLLAQDSQSKADPDAGQELWFGVLDAGSRQFRFAIELTQTDGKWAGKLLSIDEGGQEFALSDVERSDSELAFRIKISAAQFNGRLEAESGIVDGKWNQRTASLPLKLERVDAIPVENLEAIWSGQIKVLFQKIDVRIRETADGKLFFDSVSQKAGGFVAEKTVDGETVMISVPGVAGTFEGELQEGGEKLVGKWKQGLVSTELILEKAENPAAPPEPEQPKRPQTPQPPFPYLVEDVEFRNDSADVTLAGTLTIPKSEGGAKPPVVILISGSGPQDRDESLLGHKPFWVIADHFSRNGIAVLRFDDRGVAGSSGDFSKATSEDFAGDVEAAMAFVAGDERLHAGKIGLCGHSEGGLIAPMVAARNDQASFLVLMAGPGVNGEKIVVSQTRLLLRAGGMSEADIERQSKIQRVFIDLAQQTPVLSAEEFKKQAKEDIQEFLTEAERAGDSVEQMVSVASAQLQGPWFRYFMVHEPAESLAKVTCPVLAINGEKDLQVDPDLNLPAIEQALKDAGNSDFKTVELPGLNHLFQECETGLVQEYAEIEETFSTAALTLMTDWILEHTK